jgi:hypothetical protein
MLMYAKEVSTAVSTYNVTVGLNKEGREDVINSFKCKWRITNEVDTK